MSNRSAAPFSNSAFSLLPGSPFASAQAPEIRPRSRERPHVARHAAALTEREDVPVDELSFHHLQTTEEIAGIAHLREELQLPASVLADPGFHTREKKETSMALSADLPCAERLSERFDSFR